MLRKIARLHPFLWLAAITVVVMLLGPWVPLEYDDRGVGTAWFVFTYALTWVFRQTARLADVLVGSSPGLGHTVVGLAIGIAVYVGADILLSKSAAAFGEPADAPSGSA